MAWTTINEEGQIQEIQVLDSFPYSYDRMQSIADYTGYDFSTIDQSTALINDIKNEALKTASAIDETVSSVGTGIASAASLLKYAPFIIGGFFLYDFLKGGKKSGIIF